MSRVIMSEPVICRCLVNALLCELHGPKCACCGLLTHKCNGLSVVNKRISSILQEAKTKKRQLETERLSEMKRQKLEAKKAKRLEMEKKAQCACPSSSNISCVLEAEDIGALSAAKWLTFNRLLSVHWPNETPGVNAFIELEDTVHVPTEIKSLSCKRYSDGSLVVDGLRRLCVSRSVLPDASSTSDYKYRCFGFHYQGTSIPKAALEACSHELKEAYGVEVQGTQFVCLVLWRGHRIKDFPSKPYKLGLLSADVIFHLIPGSDRHVSVYKVCEEPTDDLILGMLKRPCKSKWKWTNPKVRFQFKCSVCNSIAVSVKDDVCSGCKIPASSKSRVGKTS